jgi:hypothetical protein
MLKRPESGGQAEMVVERTVPLDRSRTFITLLVVLYHSVINYTYYGIGGDRMSWIGFDGVVLFCDSFFMACMFFISGLFVCDSLARRGAGDYLASRLWRLGVPYLVSVLVIMPLAYYRYWLQFDFPHYYWQMITVGPWSAGSAWFLFVLLAFNAVTALVWVLAPRTIGVLGLRANRLRDRPMVAFAIFTLFSIATYLPLRLYFGASSWLAAGHYPLVIQTSRILLYAGYFLAGIAVGAAGLRQGLFAEGGAFARRWSTWIGLALAFYASIVFLVYGCNTWCMSCRCQRLRNLPSFFAVTLSTSWAMASLLRRIPVLARMI